MYTRYNNRGLPVFCASTGTCTDLRLAWLTQTGPGSKSGGVQTDRSSRRQGIPEKVRSRQGEELNRVNSPKRGLMDCVLCQQSTWQMIREGLVRNVTYRSLL